MNLFIAMFGGLVLSVAPLSDANNMGQVISVSVETDGSFYHEFRELRFAQQTLMVRKSDLKTFATANAPACKRLERDVIALYRDDAFRNLAAIGTSRHLDRVKTILALKIQPPDGTKVDTVFVQSDSNSEPRVVASISEALSICEREAEKFATTS